MNPKNPFSPAQIDALFMVLNGAVRLYEYQIAGLGNLPHAAVKDLLQERLDLYESARELVALLAQCE